MGHEAELILFSGHCNALFFSDLPINDDYVARYGFQPVRHKFVVLGAQPMDADGFREWGALGWIS